MCSSDLVRELGAVIDRAALLGNGKGLEVSAALGVSPPGMATGMEAPPPGGGGPVALAPLDAVMKHHIEAALAATSGRIEGADGAARVLRINPHTLRARMRKLGIDWARFRSPR